jgi:hypothetical protein
MAKAKKSEPVERPVYRLLPDRECTACHMNVNTYAYDHKGKEIALCRGCINEINRGDLVLRSIV